jgi:hypothetical protein
MTQTYAAVAGKLKMADPLAAEELAGRCEAIGNTTEPSPYLSADG